MSLAPPRHLVVRLPNPLGDAVMATPALRALRAALPQTRITWAGGPAAQAALAGLPFRDGVVPLAGPLARGVAAPWRAARLLRRLDADAILLLPNSFSTALAARLARIPVRVGTAQHGRGPLLTVRLATERDPATGKPRPRPMTAWYLDLVRPFGAADDGRGTEVVASPFDRDRAAQRLADVPAGVPVLAISPGARFGETKVYPPRLVAAAVARLREARAVVPLVLAGPGEQALAARVARAIDPPLVTTHEDPPGVGELKGLLARAALLLTADAGPRHLADALGTPTLAWLGPTDPAWSRDSPGVVVRNEALPCLGCHLTRCPIGLPCMEQLDPDDVARAATALLGRGAGIAPPR